MTHDYKKALDLLNEHGEAAYVFELGGSETIRQALELAIALQPKPISEAEVDKEYVLYCPERGIANNERFEYRTAHTSRGSHHSWATHFYDISALPKPEVSE